MMYAPLVFVLTAQLIAPKAVVTPASRAPSRPVAAAVPNEDEILNSVGVSVSGPGLLAFFHKRMTPSVDTEQLVKLTNQLSDKSGKVHTKAMAELVGLGPLAVPALRKVVNQADNEQTRSRARKCLQAIEGAGGSVLVQVAVRALAAQNLEGAADTLVNYLPFADDESVLQEIEAALLSIGKHDGKPVPALMRALTDPTPIRRGIAARVLCQIGGSAERAAIRPLLKDPKPTVRMLAALSLAELHDAEAMTVLIDLVGALPPEGRRRVEDYLTELAGEWAVKTPQGVDAVSSRLRRELWSTWWNTLDGKQLLEEFRSRTLTDEERSRVLQLIEKSNEASPDVRTKAVEDLIGMGPRTASFLRQILERRDTGPNSDRQKELSRQCLASIEGASSKPLPEAATRLLALRRPRGTIETLVAYIPCAESETISAQIIDVLANIGCSGGKGDPALVRALEDKVSVRRAAAAVALCKGTADEELHAVRKLLADADTTVRLQTAAALAHRGDKSAVPVLIALLADLPLDQAWQAEDILTTLAGEAAPDVPPGDKPEERRKCRDTWAAWWKDNAARADLGRLANHVSLGLIILCSVERGRVFAMDRRGRERWSIEVEDGCVDAVVLPGRRVLIAENNANRVTERDFQGNILWQKPFFSPANVQRLPSGNTFIAGPGYIVELDRASKEVYSLTNVPGGVQAAYRSRKGHIVCLTQNGQCLFLDTAGKVHKSFVTGHDNNLWSGLDLLPNDHVLVPLSNGNKVVEFDGAGRKVWEAGVQAPTVATKLPNGHVWATSRFTQRLVELNRAGKVVWEYKNAGRPYRARPR
jgi:HEAT repeat protein